MFYTLFVNKNGLRVVLLTGSCGHREADNGQPEEREEWLLMKIPE
jgi:hypothetical protein